MMNRKLHFAVYLFSMLLMSAAANAQTAYWREGFSTWDGPTSDPGNGPWVVGTANAEAGIWGYYGIWRTTGTGCPYSDGTPNPHIRSSSNTAYTGNGNPNDTAYLVTPLVSNGISQVSFIRSRNFRRTSFYWTPDTSVTTTNWIFVASTNKSTASPAVLCTDTIIDVSQPTAKRLQIRFERGGNSDVDSIVLFSSTPIVPINFANVKAFQKGGGVQVEFENLTESNMVRYIIERSADGVLFEELTSLVPSGNNFNRVAYTAYDAMPLKGNNVYRVKGVEKDGKYKYSTLVKVALGKTKGDLVVAPNPVKGNTVNLQFESLGKGGYAISIFNGVGQQVFNKIINHEGGAASYQVQLPGSVKSGIYNLVLKGGEIVINKKVVVE